MIKCPYTGLQLLKQDYEDDCDLIDEEILEMDSHGCNIVQETYQINGTYWAIHYERSSEETFYDTVTEPFLVTPIQKTHFVKA